jgi:hypothetical protein
MKRRADGDYGADDRANQFPELQLGSGKEQASDTASIRQLFEGWKREALATNYAEKTADEYEGTLNRLIAFLGHDNAGQVVPRDIVAYKDMRLRTINARTGTLLSAKTVKDGDLAALKTVFGWGAGNHYLPSNPAEGITINLGDADQERPKERPKGYTNDEAIRILSVALTYVRSNDEREKTAAAKRREEPGVGVCRDDRR